MTAQRPTAQQEPITVKAELVQPTMEQVEQFAIELVDEPWIENDEILARLIKVEANFLRNKTAPQIAKELGITPETVRDDLKKIRHLWSLEDRQNLYQKRQRSIAYYRQQQRDAEELYVRKPSAHLIKLKMDLEDRIVALEGTDQLGRADFERQRGRLPSSTPPAAITAGKAGNEQATTAGHQPIDVTALVAAARGIKRGR